MSWSRPILVAVAVVAVPAAVRAETRPTGGAGAASHGLVTAITTPESYGEQDPVTVHLTLTNSTDAPIAIMQRLDAFEVDVYWPGPSREGCTGAHTGTRSRHINFAQTHRGQVAPTPVPLAPGATLTYDVDLAGWAHASGNGQRALGAGRFEVVARYGKARSRAAGFTVAGAPGKGRCPDAPDWRYWGR